MQKLPITLKTILFYGKKTVLIWVKKRPLGWEGEGNFIEV
jgi:hypothetical protein